MVNSESAIPLNIYIYIYVCISEGGKFWVKGEIYLHIYIYIYIYICIFLRVGLGFCQTTWQCNHTNFGICGVV